MYNMPTIRAITFFYSGRALLSRHVLGTYAKVSIGLHFWERYSKDSDEQEMKIKLKFIQIISR
jgi:hypothetical protein